MEHQPLLSKTVELRNNVIVGTKKFTITRTAISPSGRFAVLATDTSIRVFDSETGSLLWRGELEKTRYKYALGHNLNLISQTTGLAKFKDRPKFTAVAISDEYVVLSVQGKTLFLAVTGRRSGQIVLSNDHIAFVDKLVFHADDGILLSLMRSGMTTKARIYDTGIFTFVEATQNVAKVREDTPYEVNWKYKNVPRGAAFASNGKMIAVFSNTDAKGKAELWILRRCIEGWKQCGHQEVQVLSADPKTKGSGLNGITGLALYLGSFNPLLTIAFKMTNSWRYRYNPILIGSWIAFVSSPIPRTIKSK
jgi:WD40 repeat protein